MLQILYVILLPVCHSLSIILNLFLLAFRCVLVNMVRDVAVLFCFVSKCPLSVVWRCTCPCSSVMLVVGFVVSKCDVSCEWAASLCWATYRESYLWNAGIRCTPRINGWFTLHLVICIVLLLCFIPFFVRSFLSASFVVVNCIRYFLVVFFFVCYLFPSLH